MRYKDIRLKIVEFKKEYPVIFWLVMISAVLVILFDFFRSLAIWGFILLGLFYGAKYSDKILGWI